MLAYKNSWTENEPRKAQCVGKCFNEILNYLFVHSCYKLSHISISVSVSFESVIFLLIFYQDLKKEYIPNDEELTP